MPGTALITGITGQDGTYLAEHLLGLGYQVYGLVNGQRNPMVPEIERICPGIQWAEGDLLDQSSLIAALETSQPNEVYNLGAISFVALSFKQAIHTGEITGLGVTRMLEAIRVVNPKIRFYQASSSEMFGKVRETPQNELTPFHPRSPYGVAKVYGHYMTVNYRESYGMYACSGILFNHESPRRGFEFVTRKISNAVARLMLQQDEADDYVIATGETHSVREFCERAFSHAGLSWEDHVVTDERFLRPAEVDVLVGDSSKAERVLGWRPEMRFEELVTTMVDADLELQGSAIRSGTAF